MVYVFNNSLLCCPFCYIRLQKSISQPYTHGIKDMPIWVWKRYSTMILYHSPDSLSICSRSFQFWVLWTWLLVYRKVASSRLSWLVAHPSIFRMFIMGEIWCSCTYCDLWSKFSKLNSRPINCSQLYGKHQVIWLPLNLHCRYLN